MGDRDASVSARDVRAPPFILKQGRLMRKAKRSRGLRPDHVLVLLPYLSSRDTRGSGHHDERIEISTVFVLQAADNGSGSIERYTRDGGHQDGGGIEHGRQITK